MTGILPSDIEKKLDAGPGLGHDGINLLTSLLTDIGKQQERIAIAQEKRAQTEEKKIEALNHIATAIREMNRLREGDPAAQEIVQQTAAVIAAETEPPVELDDLSKLIDELDDLSKLIDEPESTPAITIEITPEQDLKKYKAAIMEIIIQFKTEGLTVEETTNRLNKNNITTLSGKPEWSQKAISQIYKFIASAQ